MLDIITSRTYFSAEEIAIGTSAILSCFEMSIFALLHIKAFSYKPYKLMALLTPPADETTTSLLSKPAAMLLIPPKRITTNRWAALGEVCDLRDMAREIWEGVGYLFHFEKIEQEIFEERRRNDLLEGGFEERGPIATTTKIETEDNEAVIVNEKERERRKLKKSRIKSSMESTKHERFATLDSVELSDLPIPHYDDSLLPPHRLSGFVTSNSHSPSIANPTTYTPSIARTSQIHSAGQGSRIGRAGGDFGEQRDRTSRIVSRPVERGLPPGARQSEQGRGTQSGFIFERY